MQQFIKAVGRGQKRARDLTRDEARAAMGLIADGEAAPVQVGAFLLSLRMKGESGEELAGFVEALAERSLRAQAPAGTLDVDCHGDGHAGRPTLLPAAACAAMALGVPVALRTDLGNAFAKHGLRAALRALGLELERPLAPERAARALVEGSIGVVDLPAACAPLAELVALRPLFGLRTVAQTLMKLIDPLAAGTRLVGVFHAPYLPSTAQALGLLGARALCVQAAGGLPEASPGKQVRVAYSQAPEPALIDLRRFVAPGSSETESEEANRRSSRLGRDEGGREGLPLNDASALAVRENRAALDGAEPAATRAAAACALLLHAARGTEPMAAAAQAHRALTDGSAARVAARLVRA